MLPTPVGAGEPELVAAMLSPPMKLQAAPFKGIGVAPQGLSFDGGSIVVRVIMISIFVPAGNTDPQLPLNTYNRYCCNPGSGGTKDCDDGPLGVPQPLSSHAKAPMAPEPFVI